MSDPIMELKNVSKTYRKKNQGKKQVVRAASEVSIQLPSRSILALVGESGSGKTTLARLITGIEQVDAGQIFFQGHKVNGLRGKRLSDYRKRVQMVFQDPFASINPLNSVYYTLSRPLANYRKLRGRELQENVFKLLRMVHLTPVEDFVDKFPHELSGGQLQRVGIARALGAGPELIIADEPISMLDVSIRAEVLQLLSELRDEYAVSVVYITHDLVSARILADKIVVLYRGIVVEQGKASVIARNPKHPYTRLLLSSIPDPRRPERDQVFEPNRGAEDVSTDGCVFATRCPMVMARCRQSVPAMVSVEPDQSVTCFLYSEGERGTENEYDSTLSKR